MSVATYNVRLRRDRRSYADVTTDDPILLYGEIIFVYDVPDFTSDRIKVGNGRDPFSELPWYEDVSKINKSAIGQPGGLVPLDSSGVISEEYVPQNFQQSIDPPTVESLEYTGEQQSPAIYVDTIEGQVLTGDMSATEPGTYMMAAKPAQGYIWTDGSTDTVFLPWSIGRSDD